MIQFSFVISLCFLNVCTRMIPPTAEKEQEKSEVDVRSYTDSHEYQMMDADTFLSSFLQREDQSSNIFSSYPEGIISPAEITPEIQPRFDPVGLGIVGVIRWILTPVTSLFLFIIQRKFVVIGFLIAAIISTIGFSLGIPNDFISDMISVSAHNNFSSSDIDRDIKADSSNLLLNTIHNYLHADIDQESEINDTTVISNNANSSRPINLATNSSKVKDYWRLPPNERNISADTADKKLKEKDFQDFINLSVQNNDPLTELNISNIALSKEEANQSSLHVISTFKDQSHGGIAKENNDDINHEEGVDLEELIHANQSEFASEFHGVETVNPILSSHELVGSSSSESEGPKKTAPGNTTETPISHDLVLARILKPSPLKNSPILPNKSSDLLEKEGNKSNVSLLEFIPDIELLEREETSEHGDVPSMQGNVVASSILEPKSEIKMVPEDESLDTTITSNTTTELMHDEVHSISLNDNK